MARSAKIYDFTIQPGGSFTLLVEGTFYRIQSSSGALEVRRDGGSGIGPIFAGQGERGEEFKRLTLVDKSGQVNKGFIVVSDGTFVDDRITGFVEVIDAGKNRSASGNAYAAYASVGASAGQFGNVQIWNPAGSGKNLFIERVTFTLGAAGSIYSGIYKTALPTLGGLGGNKETNGPAPSAVQRTALVGVNPNMETTHMSVTLGATAPYDWELRSPLTIEPGSGMTCFSTTQNCYIQLNVEFFEEPV